MNFFLLCVSFMRDKTLKLESTQITANAVQARITIFTDTRHIILFREWLESFCMYIYSLDLSLQYLRKNKIKN